MKKIIVFFILLLATQCNAQIITTFAGNGAGTADGTPAIAAALLNPAYGKFDRHQNYYISLTNGAKVIMVTPAGTIKNIAGTGVTGFSGDGGLATNANLGSVSGLAIDSIGNVYFTNDNHRIRKVNVGTGIITTVVGTGTGTYSGDGGPATAASINNPCDVCIDNYGNILIADYFNARVRKVSPAGIITTFAGNGLVGYSGDGKRADTSAIGGVTSIYADASNNIYLASISNSIVIKVNPAGIMSTVAGVLGSYVYLNDNVPATSTPINAGAITMDRTGNLYICDQINNRVRKVDVHGIIQTIAGNGTMGSSGDGGPATAAELGRPDGVAVDTCGNVYIPEANTNRVRKVTYDTCSIPNSIATYQPKEVELYPNPVTSTLFVSFNEAGTWSLTLYDILGNTVATLNSVRNNADIDLSNVSPGVYVLRAINMNNGGNVLMKKIVKN